MDPSNIAAIFFFLTISVNVVVSEVNYKHNCFSEDTEDSCNSKTIEIGGKLYGCDDVIYFKNRIETISFENNKKNEQDIKVLSGETFYTVNNGFKVIKEVKATNKDNIVRCSYLSDEAGNAYKIEDSTVYAIGKKGIERVIEIPDNEEGQKRLAVDIALDIKSNQLIISTNRELFSFNLVQLKKNGKLTAKLITPNSLKVSAYAIFEGLETLLLGLDVDGKFKVVQISTVAKNHSCAK